MRRLFLLAICAAGLLLGGTLHAQTRVWTDSVGARVTLHGAPQRVISLAPSLTEDVFALGAGGQLVGDTNFCNHPAAARSKVKVGSMLQPNAEIILRLHPDLVLATQDGDSAQAVHRLEALGIPVYTFSLSRNYAAIRQNYLTMGALLGRAQTARRQMQAIDHQLAAMQQKLQGRPRSRVFLQLGVGSLFTASGLTFANDILQSAGAVNVMAALPVRYPQVSREAVLAAHPDAILVTVDPSASMQTRAEAEWSSFPSLRRCGSITSSPWISICSRCPRR
jgi:ABC-type Fe3+-hydroxamate transport system substrate-binding protein